jgi:hypothetical protein
VEVDHVVPGRAVFGGESRAERRGLVVRVVEHLDLEAVARPVERRHAGEEPLDDVHLVEDGELHGDQRQVRRLGRRGGSRGRR